MTMASRFHYYIVIKYYGRTTTASNNNTIIILYGIYTVYIIFIKMTIIHHHFRSSYYYNNIMAVVKLNHDVVCTTLHFTQEHNATLETQLYSLRPLSIFDSKIILPNTFKGSCQIQLWISLTDTMLVSSGKSLSK